MRILVIEDEPDMARLIAARLAAAGFVVDRAGTIAEAEAAIAETRHAVAVLDRRLPDGDGAAAIARLRAKRPGLPVILVTALDAVAHRIQGLDAGADDYVTKPFDADELLARIRAALRRPGGAAPPPIACGALVFEPVHRAASVAGRPLPLRRRELAILEALVLRAGRVVTREHLVEAAFGFDDDIQPATIESHISRLRARLAAEAAGVAIHPVRGVGYMLAAA